MKAMKAMNSFFVLKKDYHLYMSVLICETMESLPEHIIKKIKEYIPNHKDFKSPTSICFKQLISYYSNNDMYAADSIKISYLIRNNEPFHKYVLRINRSKLEKLNCLTDSDYDEGESDESEGYESN